MSIALFLGLRDCDGDVAAILDDQAKRLELGLESRHANRRGTHVNTAP